MYRRAQSAARRSGISLAEFFRRALGRALGPEKGAGKKPWMRFSGVITGGRPDESDNDRIDGSVYDSEP